MELVATDPGGGEFGYDYWQATVETGPEPAILDYHIVAQDGGSFRVLSDDRSVDGGEGQVGREILPGLGWQITAYDPGFETPDWARGAVAYQILPDRFANAEPGNDPSPDAVPGASGAERYRRGDVYGIEILQKDWDDRPEAYCRAYVDVSCSEPQAFNRDFFGGDLAGITAGLEDLADLGVTAIYLNPIFASPSNHRYDTLDYDFVDPGLGTLEDFERLVREAQARGIHIILDGVFNHVSSASPWFDRYGRYDEVGACESASSPQRDWFTFRPPSLLESDVCAPSVEGGDDTAYVGWGGYDTIPELEEIDEVEDLFVGDGGVVRDWLERGASGWRLDAADRMGPEFLALIRDATKETSPDAIVIAEQWWDSTPWLLGDQADSTMNYRFRRAVIALVNGETNDPDGALAALTPSRFAAAMESVREDYPPPAFHALMNLVDSHDTSRILWTLTPGPDNDKAKSDPTALAEGKTKLRLLSTIQLTFPGMATIYYGDEVGLSGHDDPDDRRPYPWGAEDLELRDHYRTLARMRADHEALREGDLEFLHADDEAGTLAYLRRSPSAAAVVALNLGGDEAEINVPVDQRVPDGAQMDDVLGTVEPVSVADGVIELELAPQSAVVLVSGPDADLTAPAAPVDLAASPGDGLVDLRWSPVDDAARYQVLRSLVTGGGYQTIGDSAAPAFVDASVRDGVRYHYVVVAADEPGNVSARSNEAVALPQLSLTAIELSGLRDGSDIVDVVRLPLSVEEGLVEVEAVVKADVEGARILDGIVVEVGIAPEEVSSIDGDAWTWTPARGEARAEGVATYRGTVQPEAAGGFTAAVRASTDGGRTWRAAPNVGRIEAVPGDDVTAPSAPGTPEPLDVSPDRIHIGWSESDADDLHRYLVLRVDEGSDVFELIGATEATDFVDATIASGRTYRYTVRAQDSSFNTSAPSEPLEMVAAERVVAVTWTVSVPDYTTPDDSLFIAGDFQGWSPGSTPITRVDDTTWEVTLEFDDRENLQYKFTRGTWETVEKDAECAEIPNRELVVDYGSDGTQQVDITVEKWRDLDQCP